MLQNVKDVLIAHADLHRLSALPLLPRERINSP